MECAGRVTPFRPRRHIELVSSEIVFSYRIDNLLSGAGSLGLSSVPDPSPRQGFSYPDHSQVLVESASFRPGGGNLTLANMVHRKRRSLENGFCFVSPSQLRYLGIWITRGGWRGSHHFALEPTNASCDALSEAPANNQMFLPARGIASGNS